MSYLNRVISVHKQLNKRLKKSGNLSELSEIYYVEAERIVRSASCFYCDVVYTKPDGKHNPTGKTADHIIPRSQLGRNHPSNYVDACGSCNQKRGTMDFLDFSFKTKLLKEYKLVAS